MEQTAVNNIEIAEHALATGTVPAQRGGMTLRHKDEEFLNLIAVGFIAAGDRLVHPADGETVVVRADGTIEFEDYTWLASPTAALNAGAAGRNGWKDWVHKPSGRTLAELHVAARNFVV